MQHTSPDRDARLLPWIDATGLQDGIHTRFLLVDGKGVLAGDPSEMQDALKYCAWSEGFARLMLCLMHSDEVRCEVCKDDAT